jgi:hypothetical protein
MSVYGGPDIVTDGLVLHLDAANSKSYSGSGTSWNDLSGSGNNGTLTNGPTFSSSNGGNIVFDGGDDYIAVITNGKHITNLTACTYNFFVNFANFNKTYNQLAETYSTDSNYQFSTLVKSNGKLAFYVFNTSGNQSSYDGTGVFTLLTNTWYMLTFVFQGSTRQQAYVNGVLDGSASTPVSTMVTSTQNLRIGFSIFGNRYTAMRLVQFQSYNRALSSTEILQNYNALKGRYGL